jgi:DNA-binding NtrC family response regulator
MRVMADSLRAMADSFAALRQIRAGRIRELLTISAQAVAPGGNHTRGGGLMPRHTADESAKRPPFSAPTSFGLPAIHVSCVGQLVGYALATVDRELILQTLRRHRGNRTHTAKVLGISVRSLRDRIRTYRHQGESVPEPNSNAPLHPVTGRDEPSALSH